MGELAKRVRAKYPSAYTDMDDQQLEAAVLAKYPEYKDLAGTQAPQPEAKPGFSESFAATYGAPRTPEEAASMLTGRSGDMEGAQDSPYNPPGGVNLPGGFNPGNAARNIVSNMGASVARGVKGGVEQFKEAAQNIREGGPILSNLGKAASGYADITSSVNPVVAAGGQGGQQVAEGNLPGAAGSFAGGLSQGYMVGKGAGLKAETPSLNPVRTAVARSGVEAVLQPMSKEFRFGKDPVGFVIDNGITANSLEELHNNIKGVVDQKTLQLESALKDSPAGVDLAPAKKLVRTAMDEAIQQRDLGTVKKLSALYKTLSNRLIPGGKKLILGPSPNMVPAVEASQVKRGIQNSINWSDASDKPLNNIKLQVQHVIADSLHQAVPATAALDESISSGIEALKAAERQSLAQQAGRRTVRNGTRVPVVTGAIGGMIGGPTGLAAGATAGRIIVKGMGEPAIGTRLGKLAPRDTPYPR